MDERCDNIRELLPWLLNGTLSSAETISTLHHVQNCSACKKDLAALANMQKASAAMWLSEPEPAFLTPLWSQIQADIAQSEEIVPTGRSVRAIDSAKNIRDAVFPLGPAFQAVQFAYRTVFSELRQVLARIIPRLHVEWHSHT